VGGTSRKAYVSEGESIHMKVYEHMSAILVREQVVEASIRREHVYAQLSENKLLKILSHGTSLAVREQM
jgi:hypothetical protein